MNNPTPSDPLPLDLHKLLWAKSDPYHLLWRHLLDAAAVCRALIPRFGCPGGLSVAWVCYLVALHDIGKADPLFQIKLDILIAEALLQPLADAGLMANIRKADGVGFRHEARSSMYLSGDGGHLAALGWGEYAIEVVQQAINGHHGDFHADAPSEEDYPKRRAQWNALRDNLAAMVAGVLGLDPAVSRQPQDFDECGIGGASAVGLRLSGLIVLSDWIASNNKRYRYDDCSVFANTNDAGEYWAVACREAERAVACLELDPPQTVSRNTHLPRFSDVWPAMAATARPSQRKLNELVLAGRVPLGMTILEAPMGEGKTEAAVYLSEVWRILGGRLGAYIALPTQATSNQLHSRYRKFLWEHSPKGSPPRLVHGMAWLMDMPDMPSGTVEESEEIAPQTYGDEETDDEPILAREWFQSAKRALLAPEGVGTVDQALFGALNVKHGFLRLYGLTTKTLIVDEVHAYDAYMTSILCRLLAWCRALEIPVILLSATLSRAQKSALVAAYTGKEFIPTEEQKGDEPYPLLTFAPLDGTAPFTEEIERDPERNVKLGLSLHRGLLDDPQATAHLAYEQVRNGCCAGVIVNTVKSAQAIFNALETIARDEGDTDLDLTLFHARFRAEKRGEIETEVTGKFGKTVDGAIENACRPQRGILVATQVAEQSLDIDMDVLLTQIAPIDLLLQRAGRMHRHTGRLRKAHVATPVVHVLLPSAENPFAFGTTERVYARELLLRTLALLTERLEINLPEDFRRLIEGCYSDTLPESNDVPADEMAQARKLHREKRQVEENAADPYLIALPRPDEFTYAMQKGAFDEAVDGDGKPASYLRARTRLGDETRSVLILGDPGLLSEFDRAMAITNGKRSAANTNDERRKASRWSPRLELLRSLFLQKGNVPIWWFPKGATAADGFEPVLDSGEEKIAWLRYHAVLRMNEAGEWRGVDAKGRSFTIRDHPTLGLTYEGDSEKDKNDATV